MPVFEGLTSALGLLAHGASGAAAATHAQVRSGDGLVDDAVGGLGVVKRRDALLNRADAGGQGGDDHRLAPSS